MDLMSLMTINDAPPVINVTDAINAVKAINDD